jgi:hypothetical protein
MFYAGISLLSRCNKPVSVRLLGLRRVTYTHYPGTGKELTCTLRPTHGPSAGRRRVARWSREVGELSCAYGSGDQAAEFGGAQASGRGTIPLHVISLLEPLPHPTREAGRRPRAAVGFSNHATGLPK